MHVFDTQHSHIKVATDALVVKHQVISIHNADLISIALHWFQTQILHFKWTSLENVNKF